MVERVLDIRWIGEGYDLHLVPGMKITPSILRLVINTLEPNLERKLKWASEDIPNVNVDFKLNIKDAQNSNPVRKFGIVFDRKTGELTIGNLPAPTEIRIFNFIVEVTVTDKNENPPFIMRSAVRIHVHNRLLDAWLTPSKLSIHHGSDGLRFSVLALFEDIIDGITHKMIGDITRQDILTWEIDSSKVKFLTWESTDSLKVEIDKDGAIRSKISDVSNVEIKATFPAEAKFLPGQSLRARVDVLPSWSSLPAEAKLVNRLQISKDEIDNFPNILFIPEGYSNEKEFVEDVKEIIGNIESSPGLIPFNLLSTQKRLNYWTAFIKPPNSSVHITSALSPLHSEGYKSGKYGRKIDNFYAIKPNSNNPRSWSVQELMYRVGMPTLADFQQPDNDEARFLMKVEDWNNLFGDPNINFLDVPIALWNEWKVFGDYFLANEIDSTLGIATGTRPNLKRDADSDSTVLSWNPLRTSRIHLNKFLENLKTPADSDIGTLWTSGKDSKLVIALCKSSNAAGTVTPEVNNHLICVSYWTGDHGVEEPPALKGKEIRTGNWEASTVEGGLLVPVSDTVCHELAHVLKLGDEYGGIDSLPANLKRTVDHFYLNLQSDTELKNPLPDFGINGKNIRWNWPRITKARIVKDYLSPPGSTVTIIRLDKIYKPLYNKIYFPNRANFFRKGDLVRLRQRPLPSVKTSGEFRIISIADHPLGEEVKIESTNPAEPFSQTDFPSERESKPGEGSILIGTIPDHPEFAGDSPYTTIVHKAVRNHINISKKPLNANPKFPAHDCLTVIQAHSPRRDPTETQIPDNRPILSKPPKTNLASIIGLYDGGMRYNCNVYHPSGYCNMRGSEHGNGQRFCHVCRYILVDNLDPSLHAEIDKEYEGLYPK